MWPTRLSASSCDVRPRPEIRSPSSFPSQVNEIRSCGTRILFPVELTLHSDEAELAVPVGVQRSELWRALVNLRAWLTRAVRTRAMNLLA